MARKRYLDEAPSREYMRAIINNTDYNLDSPNYGKANWTEVNKTPWNRNGVSRQQPTRTQPKKRNKFIRNERRLAKTTFPYAVTLSFLQMENAA